MGRIHSTGIALKRRRTQENARRWRSLRRPALFVLFLVVLFLGLFQLRDGEVDHVDRFLNFDE